MSDTNDGEAVADVLLGRYPMSNNATRLEIQYTTRILSEMLREFNISRHCILFILLCTCYPAYCVQSIATNFLSIETSGLTKESFADR